MLIDKSDIQRFIPQRDPFVMIDALVDASDKEFNSQFMLTEDNLFADEETISEAAIVENIAQTCAAGFGYVNSQKGEGEGQLGFIGAISRLTVHELPKIGVTLQTKVQILNTFDNIHLIKGTATDGSTTYLDCQMKIVIA